MNCSGRLVARHGYSTVFASPIVPLGTKERSAAAEPPGLADQDLLVAHPWIGSGREGDLVEDCVLESGDEDRPARRAPKRRAARPLVAKRSASNSGMTSPCFPSFRSSRLQ